MTAVDDEKMLMQQKQNMLGKEMMFSGNVRMNAYFKTPEFVVSEVGEVDLDKLIN